MTVAPMAMKILSVKKDITREAYLSKLNMAVP